MSQITVPMSIVTIIDALVKQAYANAQKIHIMYLVGDENGQPFEEQTAPSVDYWVPLNQTEDGEGTGPWATTINISASACKMFAFDEESADYVYDVSLGGRPFVGNIKLNRVLCITIDGILVWNNQYINPLPLTAEQKTTLDTVGKDIAPAKETPAPKSPEPKKASWADSAVVIEGGKA